LDGIALKGMPALSIDLSEALMMPIHKLSSLSGYAANLPEMNLV
jgi:hypothetical protein